MAAPSDVSMQKRRDGEGCKEEGGEWGGEGAGSKGVEEKKQDNARNRAGFVLRRRMLKQFQSKQVGRRNKHKHTRNDSSCVRAPTDLLHIDELRRDEKVADVGQQQHFESKRHAVRVPSCEP